MTFALESIAVTQACQAFNFARVVCFFNCKQHDSEYRFAWSHTRENASHRLDLESNARSEQRQIPAEFNGQPSATI
jgi:hypothetical protein